LLIGIGSLIGFGWLAAFFLQYINSDAGYFLSLAERLAQGSQLYVDYHSAYPPLAIWGWTLVASLGGGTAAYGVYLGSQLLVVAACIYVFFRLTRWSTDQVLYRWIASLLFAASLLLWEGSLIMLEPWMLLGGLGALYLVIARPSSSPAWWLGGICLGLAFLAKQYAVLWWPPLLWWAWSVSRQKAGLMLLGMLSPLILLNLYHWLSIGDPWMAYRQWMVATDYLGQGGNPDFRTGIKWLIYLVPVLIIAFRYRRQAEFSREKLLLLILLCCAMVPAFFRSYPHYYMPALAFLWLWGVSMFPVKPKSMATLLLGIVVLFTAYQGGKWGKALWKNRELRAWQYAQAAWLGESLPPDSKVLLLTAYQGWNFLGKFDPIFPESVGYNFPENFSEAVLTEHLRQAPCVVMDAQTYLRYPSIGKLLIRHHFQMIRQQETGLEIWCKPQSVEKTGQNLTLPFAHRNEKGLITK
ncbi:MAG: hypothetical protein AAFR61_31880, partial [Bacteroidota bacterium]